jgi:hypothetical protein
MVNEKESLKILNENPRKVSLEEMLAIRKLITMLAEIEYKYFKEKEATK